MFVLLISFVYFLVNGFLYRSYFYYVFKLLFQYTFFFDLIKLRRSYDINDIDFFVMSCIIVDIDCIKYPRN